MSSVLVADDDAGYRYPIAMLLQDEGFKVTMVESRDALVEAAPAADIWIVDVRLPTNEQEGIQAVRQLVENGVRSVAPVIFISVTPESFADEQLGWLRHHGVDYEWLEKPFEPSLLIERVRAACKAAP